MRGINRRVRGIKEEAKGVANRAAYHVASAMEATFPVRRRVGQRPPDHGKVASFSRVPGPSPGNSGHDPGQDRPNSAEILGIGAIAPILNPFIEGAPAAVMTRIALDGIVDGTPLDELFDEVA